MRHILTFSLFTIFFFQLSFGQTTVQKSILTEKENAEWIAEFEKLSRKVDQIAKIKGKINSDSIYARQGGYNQISGGNTIQKANCECKIVFVLGFKKKAYFLDPTEFLPTNKILDLVNGQNIDKITVFKGYEAAALYGTNGRCGVIVMYSDNRELKKKVKNVL